MVKPLRGARFEAVLKNFYANIPAVHATAAPGVMPKAARLSKLFRMLNAVFCALVNCPEVNVPDSPVLDVHAPLFRSMVTITLGRIAPGVNTCPAVVP